MAALDQMFSITKTAADKNGLASLTNGILTNEEINLDTAMRTSIQNKVPGISRTVEIPGSNERVGINSLRKGNKKNPDLNRVYANNLDVDVNRQLFVGCSAADGGISASVRSEKKAVLVMMTDVLIQSACHPLHTLEVLLGKKGQLLLLTLLSFLTICPAVPTLTLVLHLIRFLLSLQQPHPPSLNNCDH